MVADWLPYVETDEKFTKERGYGSGTVKSKLQKITGQPLNTYLEWDEWWRKNNDYLIWSEKRNQLVVDEAAKRNGVTSSLPIKEITPKEYWFLMGGEFFEIKKDAGGFVYFKTNKLLGKTWVKINLKEVGDEIAKEKGYLHSLSELMRQLENEWELLLSIKDDYEKDPNSLHNKEGLRHFEKKAKITIVKLKGLTGQNFGSFPDWQKWYENYKDKLHLTEGGEILAAR